MGDLNMKTIFSAAGGAVTLTETGGVFTLSLSESIGGGASAGIVKGSGSVVLDSNMALKLGEQLLNSHLPAGVQALATVIEGVANQAIAAIE